MRRALIVTFLIGLIAVASLIVILRTLPADVASAGTQVSQESAEVLQAKIDAIKAAAAKAAGHSKAPVQDGVEVSEHTEVAPVAHLIPEHADASASEPRMLEVTEEELEAYVVVFLREKLPAVVDSIDVQLSDGLVAADTQVTFHSTSTGNPAIDLIMGGRHNLYVSGKLSGAEKQGKFDLQEVRVDGIPVPNILIEALFERYVKPTYPDADLKAPFELPWGIQSLTIESGRAWIAF